MKNSQIRGMLVTFRKKKNSLVALKVWAIPLSKERLHLTHTLYAKGACGEREERGTPEFERARFRQRQQEVEREETHTQTIECCCGGLEKKEKDVAGEKERR